MTKLSREALHMLESLYQGSMAMSELKGTLAEAALELIATGCAQFDGAPGMEPRLDMTDAADAVMMASLDQMAPL